LYGCGLPGKLTVYDVRQGVKKVYIDSRIWYNVIPLNPPGLRKWAKLQTLKPGVAERIQEYFEKTGWIVTNKNLKIHQKLKLAPCPVNPVRKRCESYKVWLIDWTAVGYNQITPEEIEAYLKAKYALFFFYYPSPDNAEEYELRIIFGKLKSVEAIKRFFEKVKNHKYRVRFFDLYKNTFDKSIWITKTLVFTVKKFKKYTATRVFMLLKEQGMIGYRNVGWKTDWKSDRRNAFIEVRKGENVQQKNIQQKSIAGKIVEKNLEIRKVMFSEITVSLKSDLKSSLENSGLESNKSQFNLKSSFKFSKSAEDKEKENKKGKKKCFKNY